MTFQRGIPVDIYGRRPAINLPERLFQKPLQQLNLCEIQ